MKNATEEWTPQFSRWRHGGWYVDNVHYPSGAVGCVSNNYEDKRWRIVCHPAPFDEQPTFRTRDAAARAERQLALEAMAQQVEEFKARAVEYEDGLFGYDKVERHEGSNGSFANCPVCSRSMAQNACGYDHCHWCNLKVWDIKHKGAVPEFYQRAGGRP